MVEGKKTLLKKGCPWGHGKELLRFMVKAGKGGSTLRVQCAMCGATGPAFFVESGKEDGSIEQAAKLWNTQKRFRSRKHKVAQFALYNQDNGQRGVGAIMADGTQVLRFDGMSRHH